MPNYGTYAICPFFNTEDPVTIKCEGIIKLFQAEALYYVRFPNKECKKHFMKCNCESKEWMKCPYAALLESTYDDKGKSVQVNIRRRTLIRAKPVNKNDIKGQLSLKL